MNHLPETSPVIDHDTPRLPHRLPPTLIQALAARNQLKPHHFATDVNQAMLSEAGRKLVIQVLRDEYGTTVQHRSLGRSVAYDELLYLEALALTRRCLEGTPYKPFRIWW